MLHLTKKNNNKTPCLGHRSAVQEVQNGQEVGYAIGGEKKMNSNTKVLYATDGFVKSYIF